LGKTDDTYAREVVAYSLAKGGRTSDAIVALEAFVGRLDPTIPSQQRVGDRAIRFITLLNADTLAAQQQLTQWEMETAQSLGIPIYGEAKKRSNV
jgi:hypothetical protein